MKGRAMSTQIGTADQRAGLAQLRAQWAERNPELDFRLHETGEAVALIHNGTAFVLHCLAVGCAAIIDCNDGGKYLTDDPARYPVAEG